MIFFVSDQHFSHSNIIKYCDRPFATVEEMNETLIRNHNRVVRKFDTVYHLGDFSFCDPAPFLSRMNGKHVLIKGNHDYHRAACPLWLAVYDTYELKHEKQRFFLSHYAHRVWPNAHRGAIHLFGHSHGALDPWGRSMDVGVDANEFFPVCIDDIVAKCEVKK